MSDPFAQAFGGVPVDASFWATSPASVAPPLTPGSLERIMREAWERENGRPPPPVIVDPDMYRRLTEPKP